MIKNTQQSHIQSLNLANNDLTHLPQGLSLCFPHLESINLNNNRLEDIYLTVDVLSPIPTLYSLYINLVTEEEVDYVLKKLPNLQYLNGLGVDREELMAAASDVNEVMPQQTSDEESVAVVHQQRIPKAVVLTEDEEDQESVYTDTQQQNQKQDYSNNTSLNHRQSRRALSRISSHARGLGTSTSRKSLLNRSVLDVSQQQQADEDLINPDEFEEIAEIYDSIRILHSKLNPDMDSALANDFDLKLREVMEMLSNAVNSEALLKAVKREKSLTAKVDLLTMCAEKVFDYLADQDKRQGVLRRGSDGGGGNAPLKAQQFQLLNGVIIGVFDGLRDAYADLQTSHMELVTQNEGIKLDLARNQQETHQLLEAAEHLEQQNNQNKEQVASLEAEMFDLSQSCNQYQKEGQDLKRYVQRLERDKGEQDRQIAVLRQQIEDLQRQNLEVQKENEQLKRGYDSQRDDQQNFQSHPRYSQDASEYASMAQSLKSDQQQQQSARGSPPQKKQSNYNSRNTITSARSLSNKRGIIGQRHKTAQSMGQYAAQSKSPNTIYRNNNTAAEHMRLNSEAIGGKKKLMNASGAAGVGKSMAIPSGGISAIIGPNQQRILSIKQLKDLISDMYNSKTKFDIKCEEGKQPKETMEQYMYTYLNQRYGLKNLIIEWAAAIITGIKTYSREDHDVALFGKILRNECDEEFRFIQQTVRETVYALLRAVIREKYPNKTEETLGKMQEQVVGDSIERWQWRKIIEKMYDEDDFRQLENQIKYKISLQKEAQQQNQPLSEDGSRASSGTRIQSARGSALSMQPNANTAGNQGNSKNKLTRNQVQQILNQETSQLKDRLKFHVFLKTVLDFQLREHEKFLSRFLQEFRVIDSDNDGILDENAFRQLMKRFRGVVPQDKVENYLQVIDPFNNQKITFSECVHLLSQETLRRKEDGADCAVLELIASLDKTPPVGQGNTFTGQQQMVAVNQR
ncbi:hypothetical protein FGO68_gene3771 [Halteria grandinella]|uniref:EF-hand domain-containing protein n=1 Tax=Halteria grandinella TaxID=5974 RepID=A0A8J8P1Y2_HALGN|nr:hypothetical protein FGO68_gene3771 [Halteria grandinella]